MGAPKVPLLAYKVLGGGNVAQLLKEGKSVKEIMKLAKDRMGTNFDYAEFTRGIKKKRRVGVNKKVREQKKEEAINRAGTNAARKKIEQYDDIPEIDEFDHPLGIDDITDIGLKNGGLVCKKPRKKGRRGMGAATRGGGAVS
jgi:hypothetical protein